MNKINQTLLLLSVSTMLMACDGSPTTTDVSNDKGKKPQPQLPIVKKDSQAPTIKLIGNPIVTVQRGNPYKDLGATANDNNDGNITAKLVISNPVNTAVLGQYKVSYNVIDKAGNKAKMVTRLVTVINSAPKISGSPKTSTHIYDTYQFQPTAIDKNNDKLTFSISNKPDWATFDEATGRLSGIATELQTQREIIISVSDGDTTSALESFDIILKGALDIAHKFGVATQGTGTDYAYYGAAVNVIDNDDSTYNHTRGGAKGENWLQIALPKSSQIHQVIIQARQGNEYRLTGAKVYLSESPYAGGDVQEGDLISTLTATKAEQAINLDTARTGSYLIIKGEASSSDSRHIHLIKAEVYGTAPVTPHIYPHDKRYLIAQNSEISKKTMSLDVIDYQGDTLFYSINNADFSVDNKGKITVNAELTTGEFNVTVSVSDGINSTNTSFIIQVTSVSAVEDVLKSGDVVNTPITEVELIQATLDEIEASKTYFLEAKAKIFNLNNNGSVKSDGTSLTQISWDPSHDASLLASNFGVNTPILYTNAVSKPYRTVYKKEIAIVGKKGGKKDKGRYAVFGANPFSENMDEQLDQMMQNTLAWLTARDGLKAEPFNVVIAHLSEDYWFKNESKTRAWLDAKYGDKVSYNVADACDNTSLAACLNASTDLLIISQVATENDDIEAITATVNQALKNGTPVLYTHYDGGVSKLGKGLFSSVFDISYNGDNYWKNLTLESYDPTKDIGILREEIKPVKTLFTHFKNNDFSFDWTQCLNSKAEKGDAYDNCSNVPDLDHEFQQGATTVKSILDKLDGEKKDIFESDNYRLQKLLALTADKFRQKINYPMDKVNTDDVSFMKSYYSDHAILNNRKVNPVQPNMGNFSRSDFSHITPITKTVNVQSKKRFRSAGVYALPGKTIKVTRTDNSEVTVKVFINSLRAGATHQYQKNGYNRPKYLKTPYFEIKPGETIELTSPYGGTLQLSFNTNDLPVSITFENVGEHPYWASSADNDSFAEKLTAGEYDWAEVATAGFEVHSKLDKMRASVQNPKWGGTAAGLAAAVVKYTSNYPHVLAGFKGEGVDVVPEIHDWANEKGLTIETIDIMKHMNADQATCGYGCSGNPYDAYWAFDPIGHGDIHELGHSLQKKRFEGFPNHAATNTFSYYTKSRYFDNTSGDNDCGGQPFKSIYETINGAVGQVDVTAYLKTNLWDKAGLGEQYLLKIQAMMHAQKMGKLQNGWHVLARVHILEREMSRAKKDWEAKKASVGFDTYTLDEISVISDNDWLVVAYSYAAGLDYRNYFDMMGILYTQKARDQIASFGFEVVANSLFLSTDKGYCSSDGYGTLFNRPTIAVDGQSTWQE